MPQGEDAYEGDEAEDDAEEPAEHDEVDVELQTDATQKLTFFLVFVWFVDVFCLMNGLINSLIP